MSVQTRAKFKVDSVLHTKQYDGTPIRTVIAAPVYGNRDPNHENSKFWAATPSGKLELGTVNAAAVAGLEPGVEFYIDITIAQ